MTAYNVVRFRVKPGMEEKFLASQRKSLEADLPGSISAAVVKTGDRSYCFIGKWKSFDDRMISGVCGGLARYLNVDATLVRVLMVVALLVGFCTPGIAYLIAWALIPEE